MSLPPENLDARAQEIYQLAFGRVAGMLAMYQLRYLKPGVYAQALPMYTGEADYEFFKNISGDTAVIALTYPEYMAYITAIEKLLEGHGYKSHRVTITHKEFEKYLAEVESGQ